MKSIEIRLNEKIGPIKDMNGVGGGPVSGNFAVDATEEFRAAGIPYSRTHDIEYPFGSGEYVDIHCIFPDFDKDVNDPKSYNFIFTDEYFKNILAAGTKVFYRLGSTIEHQPIKRYIFPPKDYQKWAEICCHIIDHYNNGWADGFEWNIDYWEIWNEPDLFNRCWTGTDEEFFELYDVAATYLKKMHPEVHVGGCAPTEPTTGYAEKFLAHVKESGAPLDFFSYHGYIHTPEGARHNADYANMLLDKYGFENVETVYDEWNYVVTWSHVQKSIDLHKTAFGAAFVAGVFSILQDSRLDISMYYDVQAVENNWNGYFTTGVQEEHGEKIPVICEKPYYAAKAWGDLKKLGTQVKTTVDKDLYVTAASDGKTLGLLISYYNDEATHNECPPADDVIAFNLDGAFKSCKAFITDNDKTNEEVPFDGKALPMQGNSMAYVEFEL